MTGSTTPTACVIAGGVGAAKLLAGMLTVVDPTSVSAVVNVADDFVLHGLHISPDLDTVTYTLADAVDPVRGWGLRDETWHAMDAMARYGGRHWFNLGDRDLGTHLHRTRCMGEGATLSDVTAEITRAWGLECRIRPVTDDPVRTVVTVIDPGRAEGTEVGFQEYFVQRRHEVPVSALRFEGADRAAPGPGVIEDIAGAEVVVVAPSNPLVSIAPVLAVPGVREALVSRRDRVVAVSPIVAGMALKGPADRLMAELGHERSVVGVARLYAPFASVLVIDESDAHLADAVEAEGVRCVVTPTVMVDREAAGRLSSTVLGSVG